MLRNLSFILTACIILTGCKSSGTVTAPPKRHKHAAIIAPLIDPAKLDTLKGKRAATPPRLYNLEFMPDTLNKRKSAPFS